MLMVMDCISGADENNCQSCGAARSSRGSSWERGRRRRRRRRPCGHANATATAALVDWSSTKATDMISSPEIEAVSAASATQLPDLIAHNPSHLVKQSALNRSPQSTATRTFHANQAPPTQHPSRHHRPSNSMLATRHQHKLSNRWTATRRSIAALISGGSAGRHWLVVAAILIVCCNDLYQQPISCQRLLTASESPPITLYGGASSQAPPMQQGAANLVAQFEGAAESRVDPTSPMRQPTNALDNFVSHLLNYAANQQQQQQQSAPGNQNRRIPLPALSINGQRLQVPVVSTPANQFIGGPNQFQQQQQPNNNNNNNNNRRLNNNFSNGQANGSPGASQNGNNQLLISSSPPSVPYLTLNRIASMANPQANNANNNQNRPFNLQPINTIPLGSIGNQQQQQHQQQNGNRIPIGLMPPPRGSQPQAVGQQQQQVRPQHQQQQQQQQFSQPLGVPRPPSGPLQPIQNQAPNPVKPISGFAPSGPPPSLAAANNAMVLVQSPANAIGQLPASQNESVAGGGGGGGGSASSTQSSKATNNDDESGSHNKQTTATDRTPAPPTTSFPFEDKTTTTASAQPTTTTTTTTTAKSLVPFAAGNRSTEPIATTTAQTTTSEQERGTNSSSSSSNNNNEIPKESNWNPVDGNRSATSDHQQPSMSSGGGSSYSNNNRGASLAPSPDIVTVPPGYNPDNPNSNLPQNYDIAVSTQMGASTNQRPPLVVVSLSEQHQHSDQASGSSNGSSGVAANGHLGEPGAAPSEIVGASGQQQQQQQQQPTASPVAPTIAPTAVTTIIWSPPTSDLPSLANTIHPTKSFASAPSPTQTVAAQNVGSSSPPPSSPPNRIRDNSLLNEPEPEPSVVYGKPQAKDSKPTPPPVSPSPVSGQASIESSVPGSGRPFIQPVQIDNQVRPYLAGAQQQQQQQSAVLKSNHHHHHQSAAPFRPSRPLSSSSNGGGQSPLQVGSGFTITAAGNQTMPTGDIQDYVAGQPPFLVPSSSSSSSSPGGSGGGQSSSFGDAAGSNSNQAPTISAQGGQDPASFDLSPGQSDLSHSTVTGGGGGSHKPPMETPPPAGPNAANTSDNSPAQASSSPAPPVPRLRRPTFKPKPAVPPIRIDSCIVGDDSSCDQSHNERCVTEYGISSCHCKPGFARLSQLRGYCSPVSTLQLSMKIDKLSDERRLVFNHTLDNPNSEEYQYLEFETIQALAGAFQQTSLARQFMGARVNKFFERKGKVWVNASVNFEANNLTRTDRVQSVAAQELTRLVQARGSGSGQRGASPPATLGDSTILLDGTKEAMSRLQDVNECASRELNDCSKFATCTNDFGTFQCQCLPGYEDKYQAEDRNKHGRVCLGCSPSYCSNRGECSINDGQKQCKCRPNFIGARCDIDSEVLAVAVGGSVVGIIILVITFWCLYLFNRRWKREQQKVDAMSATSGLTYNYVNSSSNSLMSPARVAIGGLHRSGGHQVGAMAVNYGQRFGAALMSGGGGGGHGHGYAPDQQAIICSTSSGSSAASQPIANGYAANGYQYEDAGLLIAPASTGSSEQTSPSSNSYRGIIGGGGGGGGHGAALSQMAGNAYTLSGHHHHHNHSHHHPHGAHHHQLMHHHGGHHHTSKGQPQITQFHPAATATMHCPTNAAVYDSRWRTLQQDASGKQQSALVGYYLSPDMLVGQQATQQQQLYAAPQRELCIDTGSNVAGNRTRKQQGRGHTLRSRPGQGAQNARNSSMYISPDYDRERPI